MQLGAGPVASVTDTLGGDLEAGGLVSVQATPVYKPNLQSNLSNTINGDLVAGQYGNNAAYNPTLPLDEDSAYNRRDFVPDSPSGSVQETGFLARLRRSYENLDAEVGVASNGPNVPFLFGRGTMMARSSANANDLTASSGMTVRATGIAAAGSVTVPVPGSGTVTVPMGHVLVAGPVDPVNGIMGIAPFGLTATYWNSLVNPANTNPGTDTPAVNPATGEITSTLVPPGNTATVNPNASEAGIVGLTQTVTEAIGQVYTGAGTDGPLSQSPSLYAYVPIYDTIGLTPRTIVAFAYVQWSYTTGVLSLTVPWNTTLGQPTNLIASENATASLVAVSDDNHLRSELSNADPADLHRKPGFERISSGSGGRQSLLRSTHGALTQHRRSFADLDYRRDPQLAAECESALSSQVAEAPVVHRAAELRQAVEIARSRRPQLAIAEMGTDLARLKNVVTDIAAVSPETLTVATFRPELFGHDVSESGLLIEALRSGVHDFLRRPFRPSTWGN